MGKYFVEKKNGCKSHAIAIRGGIWKHYAEKNRDFFIQKRCQKNGNIEVQRVHTPNLLRPKNGKNYG